jgi:hypothetical protein
MRALSLADSVTINPDVLFRELDGEAVLLNLDAGVYYGLDPVGTKIWELIGEYGSLQSVFDAMLREYDVDATILENDLLRLVSELCANGLSSSGDPSTGR